jgi:hypothetical protein
MLDLTQALAERTHFHTASVRGGSARFYRATIGATADRATLVWNRRAQGCVGPGCMPTAFTLTNLDLQQLDPSTGTVQASSSSTVDNVEQIRSPAGLVGQQVLYKVKASSSVDSLPAEPFALTGTRQVTPLASPEPTASLELSSGQIEPGQEVTVTARVANPSPDLTAEDAQVTLQLPAGVELVAGAQAQQLGTLALAGQDGDEGTATWTVRGTADGVHQLVAAIEAARYGESFAGQGAASLTVATPPAPGPGPQPNPSLQPGPPGPSPAPTVERMMPSLRLSRPRWKDTRLVVRGTLSRGASGRVGVTYRARLRGSSVRILTSVRVRSGRFSVTLRLPRGAGGARAKLWARYGGDRRYRAATARRRLP